MTRIFLCTALILSVAACGGRTERGGLLNTGIGNGLRSEKVEFDGLTFRARVDVISEDRRAFEVTVNKVARNLPAALEAGRFEAVKYCLGAFGASDMVWTTGPDQDPEVVAISDKDTTTLAGRCTRR